jgi:aspartate-semialdehyde dehydrogenase
MTRLAILGATGAVGSTILRVLEERSFPLDELRLLASPRSAGAVRRFAGRDITVQAVGPGSFDGIDIAIFSAGATRSREWAPQAVAAGAVVVDNSSAFRMDDGVPLVVADVNPHAAHAHAGVIANPNCSTMQLMPVLAVLHRRSPLEHVTVATYQSVSGTGQTAIDALRAQSAAVLAGEEPPAGVYAHQIAFNVLPFAGSLVDDGSFETDEEKKLRNESRKILDIPDLAVSGTCVRVPVFTGHSLSLNVEFERPISVERALELLADAPGVVVSDIPNPLEAAGQDPCYVGRIRQDDGVPDGRGLALFVSNDNLRKGAALNAIQIAELLV